MTPVQAFKGGRFRRLLTSYQFRNKFLPKDIKIVGYARTKMDHDEYLKRVRSYIKVPTKEMEEQLDQFCQLCSYVSGQYDQDDSFINLNKHLEEVEKGRQSKEQNRVFYMALPPSVFITVSEQLKRNCYPKSGLARIIVSHLPSPFFFSRGNIHANHPAPHVIGREALRQRSSELARPAEGPGPQLEGRGDLPH